MEELKISNKAVPNPSIQPETKTSGPLDILNSLPPEEREIALRIFEEMASEGSSEIYSQLLYEDYEEIPVTIDEFVDNELYLRNAYYDAEGHCKLYPFWRNKLHELFPDNISTKVNNFIESGARGQGKSEIAVLIASYLLYRVMCLKNPLQHFHMKPTEKIVFVFMNIKLALAEEIGNSKFQNTIQSSPWFQARGQLSGRTNKIWAPDPHYNIDIKIGSQASDVIGLPIYFAFFDEISFIKNQDIEKQKAKAIDMIDTAIGGMKTRFIHGGKNPTLLILASSKRSEKSFLETHMKKKLESEPDNVIIVDEAVWNVKPKGTYNSKTFRIAVGNKFLVSQVVPDDEDIDPWIAKGYKIIEAPIDFRANFIDDIDRSLCDFAGIASSEISKYISGAVLSETVNPNLSNPFETEILEIGNAPDDDRQYYEYFNLGKIPVEMKSKPLYIHMDMSVSGDMTGIAGVWIKGKKASTSDLNQANDLFYSLAFAVSIKAPKGRQISFEKNKNFIYWLKSVGLNIKGVSTDSFQSVETGQTLKAKGYNYKMISVDRVDTSVHTCRPYQYFKTTIYEQRIEMFKHTELITEITELERNANTGKVDHPDGGRKDVCDAVCGSIWHASQYAEEYAYDYGETAEQILYINDQSFNDARQLTLDMENELKKMGPALPAIKLEDWNSKTDQYGLTYSDIIQIF